MNQNLLLITNEKYFIQNEINKLRKNMFELIKIDVKTVTKQTLLELFSEDLFEERKIILIEKIDKIDKKLQSIFLEFLESMPANTLFVFTSEQTSNKNHFIAKIEESNFKVLKFDNISTDNDRLTFIKNNIEKKGGMIDRYNAQLILNYVGNDLKSLANASSQLLQDGDGIISQELINSFYQGNSKVTVFTMIDTLFTKNLSDVQVELWTLFKNNVPKVVIADALGNAFHEIANVYFLTSNEINNLSMEIGIPSWKLKKAKKRAQKIISLNKLNIILNEIVKLNYSTKGGVETPELEFEKILILINKSIK